MSKHGSESPAAAGMTRAQQTYLIVGAIAAVGILLAWLLWPARDYNTMPYYERCEYAEYRDRIGAKDAYDCRMKSVDAMFR